MSGFWESDLGEVTGKAEDAFARMFTQIPDGTMALARIEAFINAEYQGNKYLSLDWIISEGAFKGQKVNQKLKVYGDPRANDPEKARHRALNMFKLLYQLFNIKPAHGNPPSDQELALFVGKQAGIKVRETEPNDNGRQYNWVSEVHEAKGFKPEVGVSVIVTHKSDHLETAFDRQKGIQNDETEDDIPF